VISDDEDSDENDDDPDDDAEQTGPDSDEDERSSDADRALDTDEEEYVKETRDLALDNEYQEEDSVTALVVPVTTGEFYLTFFGITDYPHTDGDTSSDEEIQEALVSPPRNGNRFSSAPPLTPALPIAKRKASGGVRLAGIFLYRFLTNMI
jgi:hypothetical protein